MSSFFYKIKVANLKCGDGECAHFLAWVYDMSVNWAKFADANVCAVDWSRLASYDYSIAAQKHTRMVANCMMELMDFFIRLGMLIQRVSLAGHSLGAHVAGFFGAGYKGQVNAIFGSCPYQNKHTRSN